MSSAELNPVHNSEPQSFRPSIGSRILMAFGLKREPGESGVMVISERDWEAAANNPEAQRFLQAALEQERYLEEHGLIHE